MVQKTVNDLITEATTNLPDNTAEQISAEDVRQMVVNVINSMMARGTGTPTQNRYLVAGADGQTIEDGSLAETNDNLMIRKMPMISGGRFSLEGFEVINVGGQLLLSDTANDRIYSLASRRFTESGGSENLLIDNLSAATTATFQADNSETITVTPGNELGLTIREAITALVIEWRAPASTGAGGKFYIQIHTGTSSSDPVLYVSHSESEIAAEEVFQAGPGQTNFDIRDRPILMEQGVDYFVRFIQVGTEDLVLGGKTITQADVDATDSIFTVVGQQSPAFDTRFYQFSQDRVLNNRDAAVISTLLGALTGTDRLSYNSLRDTPSIPALRSAEATVDLLETLTGDDRLSFSAIKDVPTGTTPRTDEDIRDVVAAMLQAGSGITLTEDDGNDTLTISTSGGTPGQQEEFYYGLSGSNNPASVDLATLTQEDVNTGSGQQFDFSVGPATLNDYLILLIPSNHDLSSLINTLSGFSVLSSFSKTDDVRTIETISYHSYVLGPLVAGFTANYRATLE